MEKKDRFVERKAEGVEKLESRPFYQRIFISLSEQNKTCHHPTIMPKLYSSDQVGQALIPRRFMRLSKRHVYLVGELRDAADSRGVGSSINYQLNVMSIHLALELNSQFLFHTGALKEPQLDRHQ